MVSNDRLKSTAVYLCLLFRLAINVVRGEWFGVSPDGFCYYTDSTRVSYFAARDVCHSIGAQLPSYTSATENNYVANETDIRANIDAGLGYYGGVWLDYTDIETEGLWYDSLGHGFAFSYAVVGVPFNNALGNEDCSTAVKAHGWRWNDVPCSLPFWFACQKRIPCSEPYVSHGTASGGGDYDPGSQMDVGCNEGYSLKGDAFITCQCPGIWSAASAFPQCVRKTCPEFSIKSAVSTSSSSAGTYTHAVECGPGYLLNKLPDVVCNSGVWQQEVPGCDREECTGVAISGGQMNSLAHTHLPNSTLTATCTNPNDVMVGSAALQCQATQWDLPAAGCQSGGKCEVVLLNGCWSSAALVATVVWITTIVMFVICCDCLFNIPLTTSC